MRSPTRPGSRIVGGTFQRLSAALPAALQTLSFCGVWTRPQSTSR
ncbi:LOW QUALITY PROTEIN: putative acyl-CoA dehydrogenase [Pseudomonas aeruginosa 39016]|nr:LOW QUALITY PROTEIN: putative acyl-CoA dehydrogenase [Pseudomonas aeruginosa 39016]